MRNELAFYNPSLVELNDCESMETNGGAIVVPFLIGAGVALVANEIVERTTGQSIVTHIGNGLIAAGDFLIK